MGEERTVREAARMWSDFPGKFGIPRQSGPVSALHSTIVFEPEFRNPDAPRGIAGFSHLWLIWEFSAAVRKSWSPTVRPPRLGGNTRIGVFATFGPIRWGCPASGWRGWTLTRRRGRCSAYPAPP